MCPSVRPSVRYRDISGLPGWIFLKFSGKFKVTLIRAWHLWIFEKIIFREDFGQKKGKKLAKKPLLFDFFRQSLIFFLFLKICMFWGVLGKKNIKNWIKWATTGPKAGQKIFRKSFNKVLFSSNFWKFQLTFCAFICIIHKTHLVSHHYPVSCRGTHDTFTCFYKHRGYKHHQAEIWLRFFANF